jgi:hypothetical protein
MINMKKIFKAICKSGKGFKDSTYNKTAITDDKKIKTISLIRIKKNRSLDVTMALTLKF